MEMFNLNIQIAIVGGLIASVPFIAYEAWGFIAPGLTRAERKGFYFVGPLAVLFFLSGVATAYLVLPAAFLWFAQFLTPQTGPHVVFIPKASEYILFLIKMCLAFGLVFELPVLLMFLAWVGIVSSQMLRKSWRYALVGCAGIAAVATPSADAFTMLVMAAPLMLLYLASIGLVRVVERVRSGHAHPHHEGSLAQEPMVKSIPPQNGEFAPPEGPPEGAVSVEDARDEATQASAGH
jgi:sec-independent protein translocase protein TatC